MNYAESERFQRNSIRVFSQSLPRGSTDLMRPRVSEPHGQTDQLLRAVEVVLRRVRHLFHLADE